MLSSAISRNIFISDMANWAFEIDIADNYIIDLTGILTDKGFRIWCMHNDGQPVYLFSSEYLSTVSNDNLYAQARQLTRFIDGVSYLLIVNKDKVNKITLTTAINTDTWRVEHIQRSDKQPEIDFSSYTPGIEEDEHPVAHLLKLVPADKFIRELLLSMSQGINFKSLFQIYTLLTGKGAAGFTQDVLDRFTAAAMPLDEARELVIEMAYEVLIKYYGINLRPYVIKERDVDWDTFYDSMYD